jgi:site-specific DNA-methyltransferase (adenine-specific)
MEVGMMDLRLGRWQDVLTDVEMVDAVIVDAPYSERTHAANKGLTGLSKHRGAGTRHGVARRDLDYSSLSPTDVLEFCASLVPRCRGWFCSLTDHVLAREWENSLRACGFYAFAPLPIVIPGMTVRLLGDGPSSWTVWLVVARPRSKEFGKWGTLPGYYKAKPERKMIAQGGKPLSLMRAIIRDYTRPGDLVMDCFAGGGTTLLAAAMEGRRAIGAEMDPETYAKAKARLAKGYTKPLFIDEPGKGKQGDLL